MALFAAARKALDRGGIGLTLTLPRKFLWADGVLPAEVTLKGHKSEARQVTSLTFVVSDDEQQDSSSSTTQQAGHRVNFTWSHDSPIDLSAGEVRTLSLDIPLPARESVAEAEQKALGRESSGFLEKAFVAVTRGANPEHIGRYLVSLEAHVEGATRPKRTSKHVQQGSGFSFGRR